MIIIKTSVKQSGNILTKSKIRIWELDFLKGIAFLFMVWDHVVYDLGAFFGVNTQKFGFFKEGIGIISSIIFMTVCGISVTLGRKNLRHALKVAAVACFLTAFTFAFDKVTGSETVIRFGILHFLAASILVGHFVKKLPIPVIAVLAAASFMLGRYFASLNVSFDFLFPLGIISAGFYSSDYFPIFPNLAYTFLGIIIGKTLYKNKQSLFGSRTHFAAINFLGRHTLILYVIHQPIVLGALYAVFYCLKKA